MKCDPANPKAAGPVDVWQETFPVRFGAIDKSDRVTLDAVFRFFQEAAICHAENLEVGREDMARTGQAWILSRMLVQVERRPRYRETITLRTWPRGAEKLFTRRDYDIRDGADIPLVLARSVWLIMDREKRRPLRPQPIVDTLPSNDGLDALTLAPAVLTERGNLQKTGERKALYTDVDYYEHVNNISYIQWIEDALEPRLLEKAEKIRFEINYLNEVLGGETTEILSAPIEEQDVANAIACDAVVYNAIACNEFAFEGRKTENGQAAFRAELRLWE
jgi:acyl-ACP thioesterase